MDETPLLTEQSTDIYGDGYITEWRCQPPEQGARFRVTRQTWSDDYSARIIEEIEILA